MALKKIAASDTSQHILLKWRETIQNLQSRLQIGRVLEV